MELNFNLSEKLMDDKKVIGIMSGKGGVGKSTVAALFAVGLAKAGEKVGLVDVDFTGSSQAKLFGIKPPVDIDDRERLVPKDTPWGVKVMSLALLLDDEEKPVIWRAPLMNKALIDFFQRTNWDDVDWLVVDLPPGTSDIPLSLMQRIAVDGFFLVISPQDLVKTIVAKALNMAKLMSKPILGVVENYGYFKCPSGEVAYPFGRGQGEEICAEWGIPFVGRLPIDSRVSELSDAGRVGDLLKEIPEIDGVISKMIEIAKEGIVNG